MIRVLVADDDAMVLAGLVAILRTAGDLEVVATATDRVEAVASARSTRPDVAVLDVRMPRMDGIEATRQILRAGGSTRVLVITTFEHDSYVYDALVAGAHGFLLKRAGAQQLIHAVRTLASTDAVLFPESIRDLVAGRRGRELPPLSAREQQVLRAMARGLSNVQIACELQLGVETVKTYVAAILAKVGVRDRTRPSSRRSSPVSSGREISGSRAAEPSSAADDRQTARRVARGRRARPGNLARLAR